MEKELRKALRGVLDKVHGADLSLDELMTKENSDLLAKYPVKDGAWNHPNSHYLLRIKEFLTVSKKTLERVIQALPKERKAKKVKVDWDGKELNKKERKDAKDKKGRSSVPNPGAKKRGRKPKNASGVDGSNSKSSGDGVQPEVQPTRKRGRPTKQK